MKYEGFVIKGRGQGKSLGFPTLNLNIPENFTADFGIYAARVRLEGKEYAGALHYGPIPTFSDKRPALEIFLLEYSDDEPVAFLEFELVERIREIREFKEIEELKAQIADDVEKVRKLIAHNS